MQKYETILFPIFLFVIGIVSLTGMDIFGSALLEGAAWKQNVMFALLIIFAMLPPSVRQMRSTWMGTGFLLAFFMYGGANFPGAVGLLLKCEKIIIAVLTIFLGYRLYVETWKVNKLFMFVPILAIVSVILLFPIQDQNILESGFSALINRSTSEFTSDKGFHIYLGIIGILSGISELLILTKGSRIDIPK